MRRLALICLIAGCHTKAEVVEPIRTGPGPRPGEELPVGGEPMRGVVVEAGPPAAPAPHAMVGGRRRGVPHFSQIMAVVTDADGKVALTRDALGSVRIWPALDGTREPQKVPVQSPEAMAIAPRADGSLAAMIDGTGLASLVRFDAEGLVRATAALSPDVPLSGVAVLPGGTRVIAVRADQRVSLLDETGTEVGRLSVRSGRVVGIHAAGADLVAVVRTMTDDVATFELRRMSVADDQLAWTGEAAPLAEPVAMLPHVASALSPDGKLFAYMAGKPEAATLRVVRADSGAAIRLDGDVTTTFPATTMVGFTSANVVEMAASNAGGWKVEISGGKGSAISKALTGGTSAPAFAAGLRLVGYQASLAMLPDNGDLMFLGHRELSPSSGALAADGEAAAWITSSGALVIQRFDGSDDVRIKGANDWFGTVAFVDDDHVLAGTSTGHLRLYDSRSGEVIDSIVASASTPSFMYEPSTKLIGVMRDAGVVWAIPVDPEAKEPFGEPISIGDGAQVFTLLDPELAKKGVLQTLDVSMGARRYTMKDLEGGVSIAEMKQRTTLATSAWYFDRRGRHYVSTGMALEVRDGSDLVTSIAVANGVSAIFPAPKGDRVLVTDGSGIGPLYAYKTDGTQMWTQAGLKSVWSAAWSADGTRVLAFGQGGGAVLDAKSGDVILGAMGWSFGTSNEYPTAFPPGVEPQFDF